MPNSNGYNQYPNGGLDDLMRELEEESGGVLDRGNEFAGGARSAQRPGSGYQRQTAQPQQMGSGYQRQTAPRQQNAPASRFNRRTTNGYAFSFGDEEQNTAPVQPQAQPQYSAQPQYQPQQTAEREDAAAPVQSEASMAKIVRDSIMVLGMILIFTVCAMVMLPSGIKKTTESSEQKSFFEDLNADLLAFKSDSVSAIFEIPKVFILPWGEQPAPVPNKDLYGSYVDENGTEFLTYEDPTISVKYWMERQYQSNAHFAEITIAHPTQLRTAYAGGEFGSSVKYMPQEIAQHVNAVVAVNGDYCGYRNGGILVRQNTLYRNAARGWDMLLIDSEGNFHIMEDTKVHESGIMDQYEIVNTLVFGPSLVVDGEVKLLNPGSGCGPNWNVYPSPRTAIGQIGPLHYLFCCVEGRSDESQGVSTEQMGHIMLDKGCTQAYNLDGGQSTTIILDGKALNDPLWGAQRVVTDIVYCATAIPNEEVAVNE